MIRSTELFSTIIDAIEGRFTNGNFDQDRCVPSSVASDWSSM
jgi:hypothetical protein